MLYKPGELVRIKGTISEIKNERTIKRKVQDAIVIEFILKNTEAPNPHEYLIRAYSDTGHDRFNIKARIGQELQCNCYLNGNKKKTDTGFWHTNELSLHSIIVIN